MKKICTFKVPYSLRFQNAVHKDIELKAHTIEFHRKVYYSASEKKRHIGELPTGYSGEFGPGVKSLVCVLYHDANLSQPGIVRLLNLKSR